MAQGVKNPTAMQETRETWVQSLGQKEPLERSMATHSSGFLPGESHEQRSLVGYSPWGHRELDMTEAMEQVCTCFPSLCKSLSLISLHLFIFAFISIALGD